MVDSELRKIFDDNMDKRICVIGTTCTGKTTLINRLGCGLDMDDEIFPLLSDCEKRYVCSTPWTEEIGATMDKLVRERLRIVPGCPMFGTVLIDCDLIVYLHIDDDLLRERTVIRNVDFMNAKKMQMKIEDEIRSSSIQSVRVEVR